MPRMLAVMVLIWVLPSPVAADIYTWTDEGGVVHFTDSPPPDKRRQIVDVAEPITVPMARNLRQHRRVTGIRKQSNEQISSDQKDDASRKKSKAKAAAKQQEACVSYRHKLARVQSQLRAGYSNSKGNRLRSKRRNLSQALSRECILR